MTIDGLEIRDLRFDCRETGRLLELPGSAKDLNSKTASFNIQATYPEKIEPWHYHENRSELVACFAGMIKLVLFDGRKQSASFGELMELFIGEHEPKLVKIPPGVSHGWKCVSEVQSISAHIYATSQKDEVYLRHEADLIPYEW